MQQNSPAVPAPAWKIILSTAVILTVGIWAGLLVFRTSAVAPADAPADRFSAERANRHLAMIAAQPHPIGSSAQHQVRDYLV